MSVSDKPPSSWGDRLSNRMGVEDAVTTEHDNSSIPSASHRQSDASLPSTSSTRRELTSRGSLSSSTQRLIIPDVDLTYIKDQDIVHVSTHQVFAHKTVVIFCVPGAFTPHCSDIHLPSYEAEYDRLKALGVDEVYCVSTNDPYVTQAWFQKQNIQKVQPLSDGNGLLATHMGYAIDLKAIGLGIRSKRYSALICDNKLEHVFLDEDCAAIPSMSLPDIMINYLKTRITPEEAISHLGRTIVMLTTKDLIEANCEARKAAAKYGCSLHEILLPTHASTQVVKAVSNQPGVPLFFTDGRTIGGLDDLLDFLPQMTSARKLNLQECVPFPSVDLDYGDHIINSLDLLKSRSVLVIGSPGAFTPICSYVHIMAYQELCKDFFHNTNISDIYILAVNDDCTFRAWFQVFGFKDLKFMPDHKGEITTQLGLELDLRSYGLNLRCQRFALVVQDGKILEAFVEKNSLLKPTVTSAELMLNHLAPRIAPQEHIALFFRRGCPLRDQFASELISMNLTFKEVPMSNAEYFRFLEAIGAGKVELDTETGERLCELPFCLPPVVAVNGSFYRSLDPLREHLNVYLEVKSPSSSSSEVLAGEAYPLSDLRPQTHPDWTRRPYHRFEECRRGDQIPNVILHDHGENGAAEYSLNALLRMDNVIVFSCPAAFDSLRSDPILLRFEALWSTFEASGFHGLYCVVPNDPFVANAWAQALNIRHVKMIGDGNLEFLPHIIRYSSCKCQNNKNTSRDQFWLHADSGIIKYISREDSVDPDLVLKRVAPYSLAPPTIVLLSKNDHKQAAQARQLLNAESIPFTDLVVPIADAAYVQEALVGTRAGDDGVSLQVWADGKLIGGLEDLRFWIDLRNMKKDALEKKKLELASERSVDEQEKIQLTLLKEGDSLITLSLSQLSANEGKTVIFGVTSAFEQAHASTQLCRFEELHQLLYRAGASRIYCVCPNEPVVIREWFSQLEIQHVLPICDKELGLYKWLGATMTTKSPTGLSVRPLAFALIMNEGRPIFEEICERGNAKWSPAERVLRALDASTKIPEAVYLITKTNCRVCEATEALLKAHGIQFDVLDLPSFKSVKAMNGITQIGQAVPQVWLNGRCIGGYEECKKWLESK